MPSQIRGFALWKYTAQEVSKSFTQDNEISFSAGDYIDIIEMCNEDWFEGIINGKTGFFPANHVKIIHSEAAPSSGSEIVTNKSDQQGANVLPTNLEIKTSPKNTPNHLIEEDAASVISEGGGEWRLVTTDAGVPYYWNEESGETSWQAPNFQLKSFSTSLPPETPITDISTSISGKMSVITDVPSIDHIEVVPPELIRRDGALTYKIKKELGGIEPKKQHTWHHCWAITCVGFLVLYKEDPLKAKKAILPAHVVKLEAVVIKKNIRESNKKGILTIQSKDGSVIILQPSTDGEINDWLSILGDCTREASTEAEYENSITKLFAKNDSLTFLKEDKKKKSGLISGINFYSDRNRRSSSVKLDEEEEPNKQTVKTRLNNFFKKVGEIKLDRIKEKALGPVEIVFGGTLESLERTHGKSVPDLVEKCIHHVEEFGLESQGIYRLSGNASTVAKFRNQINHHDDSDLFVESMDVNVIAALLKLFFRELQIPVIPFTMYDKFIDAMKIEDYNTRLCDIKTMVQQLPKAHYVVLEYLMKHLVRVSSRSNVNKMEPSNLAIVFGPSIIRKPESNVPDMQAAFADMMNMSFQNALVESMIIQAEWMFDGNPN